VGEEVGEVEDDERVDGAAALDVGPSSGHEIRQGDIINSAAP
jgi:hypothetical protein